MSKASAIMPAILVAIAACKGGGSSAGGDGSAVAGSSIAGASRTGASPKGADKGAELSKDSLARAIDDMLQKRPICVSTFGIPGEPLQIEGGRLPVQWPSTVAENPLLRALIQTGFATAKEVRNGDGIRQGYEVDLTPKGRKAQILDPLNGLCVATKRVAEVVRWTVPAPGQPVTVTYSWKIADPARWKNEPVFAQMLGDIGTKDAVEGLAVMQQMSDGWQVIMLE